MISQWLRSKEDFLEISISYYSDKGMRQNNEDAITVTPSEQGVLALVADGLGGHDNGEIASEQAVDTINNLLRDAPPDEDNLIEAIQQASNHIFSQHCLHNHMRTTIAALWMGHDFAVAANVGDSRIYQFRNGEIAYQSTDHSMAQMAVLVGKLNPEDIRHSKDKNKLVRALGDAQPPKVDCRTISIRIGDRFLLCSDGFWERVTEDDMLETMKKAVSAQSWLTLMREIVTSTNAPTQDNHTAIVLCVDEAASSGSASR